MIRYLEAGDVLFIHHALIEEFGGSHGIRDLHLFGSILERPKTAFGGKEMFPDVHSKAATYYESFARYYVFVDGNKRTAFAAVNRFLSKNGYKLVSSQKEVVEFTLSIATGKQPVAKIAQWLKKYSKPA